MPVSASGVMFGTIERAERRRHRPAAGEQRAAGRGVAGDAVAGAGEVFALLDDQRRRRRRAQRGPTRQRASAGGRADAERPDCRMTQHCPRLSSARCRTASGMRSEPCGTGDGSAGAGSDARQAATAVTSASVSRLATDLHAVGRGGGARAVAPGAELGADVGGLAGRPGRGWPAPCRSARAVAAGAGGTPRSGRRWSTSAWPRARTASLTRRERDRLRTAGAAAA